MSIRRWSSEKRMLYQTERASHNLDGFRLCPYSGSVMCQVFEKIGNNEEDGYEDIRNIFSNNRLMCRINAIGQRVEIVHKGIYLSEITFLPDGQYIEAHKYLPQQPK